MAALEESIREFAISLGFPLVGIARAAEADGFHRFEEWLTAGFSGEMTYLDRSVEQRRHPQSILLGVRSVIMVGMEYREIHGDTGDRVPASSGTLGKVARYAIGEDYHEVIRRRLGKLVAWLETERPGYRGRAITDTAPLLERDFARRAGLGWIGKNTMLIHPERGSYFMLGALVTELELEPDAPFDKFHCGTCTACLDECPTQAFTAPGWLDARRCISYLTIELRSPIPEELRPKVGDWLFGCDVCQEVCPWNRGDTTRPLMIDAAELLTLDRAAFKQRFGKSAMSRAKRAGLLRNAAIVLGNTGDEKALPALELASLDDDPLVRDAATWALERITSGVG